MDADAASLLSSCGRWCRKRCGGNLLQFYASIDVKHAGSITHQQILGALDKLGFFKQTEKGTPDGQDAAGTVDPRSSQKAFLQTVMPLLDLQARGYVLAEDQGFS